MFKKYIQKGLQLGIWLLTRLEIGQFLDEISLESLTGPGNNDWTALYDVLRFSKNWHISALEILHTFLPPWGQVCRSWHKVSPPPPQLVIRRGSKFALPSTLSNMGSSVIKVNQDQLEENQSWRKVPGRVPTFKLHIPGSVSEVLYCRIRLNCLGIPYSDMKSYQFQVYRYRR